MKRSLERKLKAERQPKLQHSTMRIIWRKNKCEKYDNIKCVYSKFNIKMRQDLTDPNLVLKINNDVCNSDSRKSQLSVVMVFLGN